MLIKMLFSVLCALLGTALLAQPPATKEEFEKEYQRRIQLEYLDGQYIPKDLTDAFVELNKLIDTESKATFKTMPEEEAAHKLFFSFGRWITHNWGFYGGSRLSHYLRELGVTFPDDMAQFVIITYHRNLNRKSLDIKPLIVQFQEKRHKEHKARAEKGTVIHEETRKVTKGQ